jgi:hypothetical protein
MTDTDTLDFLDECSKVNHTIDRVMREPANTLKKLNYQPPVFIETHSENPYGSSGTTTLAAQSGSAAASMAGITPGTV